VGPVPDIVLLRKSGSLGNRARTSGSVARTDTGIPSHGLYSAAGYRLPTVDIPPLPG
jgi:hypothetical protein